MNNEYRIGDIICVFMNSCYAPEDSIGKEYKKRTNKVNNFKILDEIIKDKSISIKNKPGHNDLVMHVRLGDVIENSPFSVDEHWNTENKIHSMSPHVFYINNKFFYYQYILQYFFY